MQHSNYKHIVICILIISLLICLVYYPSINGGFTHDDIPNLAANERVQIDSLSLESIYQAAKSSDSGLLKRPISMISFALNYYLYGSEPLSFKVTNICLHIISAILVFLIVFRLKKIHENDIESSTAIWFAGLCTAIWAIHPLQVSTVAYIVQRMTLLAAIFSMLSIYFYMIARTKNEINNLKKYSFYLVSAAFIVLGCFSKESACLTPLLLLIVELAIISPSKNNNIINKKLLNFLFFGIIFSVAIILAYWSTLIDYLNNWYEESRNFSLQERLLTQSRIVWSYIYWYYIPNIQAMGLHHDDIEISKNLFTPLTTVTSIIGIISLPAIAVLVYKKYPFLSIGIFWFLIGHTLESTVIPLEMAYEHRNYLPSLGLALILTQCVFEVVNYRRKLKPLMLISLALITLLTSLSFIRSLQWGDPISFAIYEVQHHPNSVRANHTLGMVYKALVLKGQNQFIQLAYKHLSKASELESFHIHPEAALIRLSYELGDPASPNWIDRAANKLKNTTIRLAHIQILGELILCKNKNCLLQSDASIYLLDAIESNTSLYNKASIYSTYLSIKGNFILEREGSTSEALNILKNALKLAPHRIKYHVDYINALLLLNDYKAAIEHLQNAYIADKNNIYTEKLDQLDAIIKNQHTHK